MRNETENRRQGESERSLFSSEALREQEARLRALINLVPEMVWEAAPDGAIVTVSERWLHYTGMNAEQIARNWPQLVLHPDDYERCVAQWTQALRDGTPYEIEVRNRRYDGQYRWFLTRAVPLKDDAGRITAWYGTTTDIHEHKLLEEQLRESEQRWHTLTEALPALVWVARSDGFVDYYNQRWCDYTGLTAEQLAGWGWEAVWHPEDLPGGRACWQESLRTGQPYEYEARLRRAADASYRWHLVRAVPQRNAAGQVLRWVGATNDIEDHKRTEAALRRSEQELVDFFENAAVGLHWVGPDGVIQRVNQAELDLLGYTAEEYVGRHIAEFHADQAVIADIFQRLMRGETLHDYEAQLRCKDGSLKTVLIDSNVLWEEGRFIHTRCFTRDITARKQVEAERERLLAELQRINRELQQFAYIVSHDLTEPLRTMHSFVQLLARRLKGKLDAAAEEDMAFITDAAQRMQQMLADLLAYTRAGQTPKFRAVDCEAVLAQVLSALQTQTAECSGVITYDPLPTVQGDAIRLGQVFQNLIGNALKFCETKPPRIHVSAVKESGHWRFAVQDNGIGIDPQHAERIFQVFRRLHTRSEYPGTGMGLAICRKIVEQHGGKIWVESHPGQGSRFYFTISDIQKRAAF